MATSETYLHYILEQLSMVEDITYRKMMGEYLIYCRGVLIGGLYDDRFLLKNQKGIENVIQPIVLDTPYPGAKDMVVVKDIENRDELKRIIDGVVRLLDKKKR